MRDEGLTLPLLKHSRNAVASLMAATVFHAPFLRRPFAYAAFGCRRLPAVHTLFREATDRLGRRLVQSGCQYESVHIGTMTAQFDVTDFTVKGCYFSCIPYERGATSVLLSVLRPGDVFVDIGANSGYFTVLAALRVGEQGRVYAFEPNPSVRARLQHHVELNGLTGRVVSSDLALGERDEDSVDFYLSCWRDNSGVSSLRPVAETVTRGGLRPDVKISVPVRRFDTWVASINLVRADLVKIDVEGTELDVLRGMALSLRRLCVPRIICETQWGSAAHSLLSGIGYTASMLDEIPTGIPNLLFVHSSC